MSCLRRGENDLLTWCNNNAERGEQLISEFQGETDTEEILDMTDVSYASHTKLKWKCKNNHIFYQTAGARTVSKYNCPYCGHETLESYIQRNAEYGLQLRNEYTGIDDQGNKVGMDQITTGSPKRMQWKCKNGHTWYTSVSHRTTSKSQCPYCTTDNTSYPEQYIFFALKNIYPDTQNRGILFKDDINKRGMEYDVVIPSIRLLIEYNGYKFHKEKEERDILKRKIASDNGYRLIQIMDKPNSGAVYTEDTIINDFSNCQRKNDSQLYNAVKHIATILNFDINSIDFEEVKRKANEYSHGKIHREKSAAYNYPILLQEFSDELNPGLNLYNLTKNSGKAVRWKCTKCGYGSKGEWKLSINDRINAQSGCAKCGYNIFSGKHKHIVKMHIKSRIAVGEFSL